MVYKGFSSLVEYSTNLYLYPYKVVFIIIVSKHPPPPPPPPLPTIYSHWCVKCCEICKPRFHFRSFLLNIFTMCLASVLVISHRFARGLSDMKCFVFVCRWHFKWVHSFQWLLCDQQIIIIYKRKHARAHARTRTRTRTRTRIYIQLHMKLSYVYQHLLYVNNITS